MNSQPLQHKILINNPQGFHLRPMALFVALAGRFESDVSLAKDGRAVNGKSILDLMSLAATQGTELTLEVKGPDAPKALEALVALMEKVGEQTPEDEPGAPPV